MEKYYTIIVDVLTYFKNNILIILKMKNKKVEI